MITILNPTNDDLSAQYGGCRYTFPAREVREVEDVVGNHILNTHGQRGLCRLKFGDHDKIAEIGAEGVARANAFKVKQVMNHNQLNLARMQVGLSYIQPTPEVKRFAAELGLELDQPASVRRNESIAEIRELQEENNDLQKQMKKLMDMVGSLQKIIAAQGGGGDVDKK
jgi:hypothetical protein